MKSIFYAWQSDLPNNLNRGFIEDCLDKAIKSANRTRSADEQLVLDKDTQGQAGMPNVAEVIFEKIQECAVFVPDLSFVTAADAARPIANPNVLIELGYALGTIGDRRVVAVFNNEFGPTSALPFDLRMRRFPFEYTLNGNESTSARQAIREGLVAELARALALAADQAPEALDEVAATLPKHAAAPVDESSFVSPGSPMIAQVNSTAKDGTISEHVYWHHGPSAWLRILPFEPLTLSRAALRALVERSPTPLVPFGEAVHSRTTVNARGMLTLGFDGQIADTLATRLTQVFRTGELWGLNKELIELPDPAPGSRFVIPWPAIAELFNSTLPKYLCFARETLQLQPPLIIVAGLAMVNDSTFTFRRHEYTAPETSRCMESTISKRWTVDSFEIRPEELFRDLYAAIFDACGGNDLP